MRRGLSADTGKREVSNVKRHINSTVSLDKYAVRCFFFFASVFVYQSKYCIYVSVHAYIYIYLYVYTVYVNTCVCVYVTAQVSFSV